MPNQEGAEAFADPAAREPVEARLVPELIPHGGHGALALAPPRIDDLPGAAEVCLAPLPAGTRIPVIGLAPLAPGAPGPTAPDPQAPLGAALSVPLRGM